MHQQMVPLLIDGDILLFKHATACEEVFEWDGLHTLVSDGREVTQRVIAEVRDLEAKLDGRARLYFSGPENWRKAVLPSYKKNRKLARKPIAYGPSRIALSLALPTAQHRQLEADDLIAIDATSTPGAIVVSSDKDFKGVPCTLFNPTKDLVPQVIDVASANRWWAMQALMGDRVDGYTGCPGIGPKSAEAALAHAASDQASLWAAIMAVYEKRGLTAEDARVQATVARILRDGEWDFESNALNWRPGK